MNISSRPRKAIMNSQGMISVDFIFSLILCVGLCIVLFSLTFTLSMAEVAQYIAFSTSRAFASAHDTSTDQLRMATEKYDSLMNNKVLRPIFSKTPGNSWFQISKREIRGGDAADGTDFSDDYYYDPDERTPHVGVRLTFVPTILRLKIMFLGSTSLDGEPFSAKITSFLIREPNSEECKNQVKQRYNEILNLDPRYGTLANKGKNQYIPLEDNGC